MLIARTGHEYDIDGVRVLDIVRWLAGKQGLWMAGAVRQRLEL